MSTTPNKDRRFSGFNISLFFFGTISSLFNCHIFELFQEMLWLRGDHPDSTVENWLSIIILQITAAQPQQPPLEPTYGSLKLASEAKVKGIETGINLLIVNIKNNFCNLKRNSSCHCYTNQKLKFVESFSELKNKPFRFWDHPLRTSANFHYFLPLPLSVGSFLLLTNFWPLPPLQIANIRGLCLFHKIYSCQFVLSIRLFLFL